MRIYKLFSLLRYRFAHIDDVIYNLILIPLNEAYNRAIEKENNLVILDEDKITNKIVWYLKNATSISELIKKRTIYIIMRPQEHMTQSKLYEPDIKFLISDIVWLEIEAKRLYDNNNWSSSEYLNDKNGLGRFINNVYSKNENNAGRIGYIQKGNITEIVNDISEKIIK